MDPIRFPPFVQDVTHGPNRTFVHGAANGGKGPERVTSL
jgi:hypothetical protein